MTFTFMKRSLRALCLASAAFIFQAGNVSAAQNDETAAVVVTGELELLYLDDFDNNRFELQYFIEDRQNNRRFRLEFDGAPPGHLRSGMRVTARGKAKGKVLYLAADALDAQQTSYPAAATEALTGEQKTLVMIGNFTDVDVTCSPQEVRDTMFNDPFGNHVDALYREMSHGAVSITGDVTGPFTIDYASTDPVCDTAGWAAALDADAASQGFDLSAYSRRVYVLPAENSCGWSGYGSIGGNPSRAWVMRCGISGVYAHELGHNLGMNHASTPTNQYGDTSDMMGVSVDLLRKINGPHQEQMGWVPDYQVLEVTQSGTYDIATLGTEPALAQAPQMLKIARPDTSDYYYLSMRQRVGFDSNISSGFHGTTSIHTYTGDATASRTFLLDMLQDNETFSDAVNGISILQVSHTDDYATVEVQIDNAPEPPPPACTISAPALTLSPAIQDAEAGAALTYSISVVNQDDSNCEESTFSLAESIPPGWVGTLSPSNLSLPPGATGMASLIVTSSTTAAAATYPIDIDVTDSSEPAHTAVGSASYTVLESCSVNAPLLTLSPDSQSGDAGTSLSYVISLQNNDTAACEGGLFELSHVLPEGWSGLVSPSTLSLSPGQTGTATLQVASADSAYAGTYSLTAQVIRPAESLGRHVSDSATYIVNPAEPPPAGDTVPPSIPTGLSASANFKQVKLSWDASRDNIAVAGYLVRRDGEVIADTTQTSYTDSTGIDRVVYDYTVSAYDAANNHSEESVPVAAGKGVRDNGGGSSNDGTDSTKTNKGKGNNK